MLFITNYLRWLNRVKSPKLRCIIVSYRTISGSASFARFRCQLFQHNIASNGNMNTLYFYNEQIGHQPPIILLITTFGSSKDINMRILLIIACALLLSACFSEDMKSSQNDSVNVPTMVSALQSPTSSAETIDTTHRNNI